MDFAIFLSLAGIHFTAVVTPGANFLVVTQTALTSSQGAGQWTVRGITTGTSLYVTAGLIGLAAVVSQIPTLFTILRLFGALYFAYFGFRMLRSALRPNLPPNAESPDTAAAHESGLAPKSAYRRGLLTSLSNPASAMYFVSLFTGFVPISATFPEKVVTGLLLLSITFGWYTIVALTFSRPRIQRLYFRVIRSVSAGFGLLWIVLSVKLALG